MAVLQIYDRLLQFPLFQGMSRDDLEIVAGHTRFGFQKVAAGREVIHAGDPCTHLYFLINGTLKIETFSDDSRYSVIEQMSSPYILQQESIFGYYQRYTHNFIALTDVNFLTLDKEEVVRLSEDFLVFRLNLMNHLATQSQKLIQSLWRRSPKTLQERISRFFFQHARRRQDLPYPDGTVGGGSQRQPSGRVAGLESYAGRRTARIAPWTY